MQKWSFAILFLILTEYGLSQTLELPNRCGQPIFTKELLAKDTSLSKVISKNERELQNWISQQKNGVQLQSIVTIPVVFHILYYTPEQNLPEEQILAQLNALNRDFRRQNEDTFATPARFKPISGDMEIEFCLAKQTPDGQPTNGITRQQVLESNIGSTKNYYQPTLGGTQVWDPRYYMNVWVCNISDTILGFTYLPGVANPSFDGIVLHYRVCGDGLPAKPPYDKGRTLVHETGHWLNLHHPWGPEEGCNFDDYVSDTPLQEDPNGKCPSWPISCDNGPDGDMYVNYMDYTYDNCQNAFTYGQKARMMGTLQTTRNLIQSSIACSEPDTTKPVVETIEIFPNPTSNYLTIKFRLNELQEAEISMFSIDGRLVYHAKTSVEMDRFYLDLAPFANGSYGLRITTTAVNQNFKFIKAE